MSGGQDKGTGGKVEFHHNMLKPDCDIPVPSLAEMDMVLDAVNRKPEEVDHPDHYNRGTIETIDFIEDRQHLGFSLQNAIKYIDRSGAKISETKEKSLRKAIWYIERELGMHRKGEL